MIPKISLENFISFYHAFLAPVRHNRTMWLEVVAITLCAIALGMLSQHDNPFQIGGGFPWIWLAPVLIALRYGLAPGIVSSLILIVSWKIITYLSESNESFPEEFFLGGLVLVMLSGEFSAAWGVRLRRAEESNHYLDERLSRITLRHLLLRLSHDRMEQEILTKPVTLRDALEGLRLLTLEQSGSHMPASSSLLQLLTQYCQLESAAIFTLTADKGYLQTSAIGAPAGLNASDPMLRYALENQSLAHLLIGELAESATPSPFLVIAPILTSDKTVLGVLAIDRMPFLALNEENLQMLSVMLGYFADCVIEADGARKFLGIFHDAPPDFAAEYSRLLRLQNAFNINSYIVVLTFDNNDSGRQVVSNLTNIRRSLDVSWQVKLGDRLLLVNLMPLANDLSIDGYLLRIETMLKEFMGLDYDEWRLTPLRISLAESDPIASLTRIFSAQHE